MSWPVALAGTLVFGIAAGVTLLCQKRVQQYYIRGYSKNKPSWFETTRLEFVKSRAFIWNLRFVGFGSLICFLLFVFAFISYIRR